MSGRRCQNGWERGNRRKNWTLVTLITGQELNCFGGGGGGDDDILNSNYNCCNLLGAECMLKNSLQNN
jgi:hypothetical protein